MPARAEAAQASAAWFGTLVAVLAMAAGCAPAPLRLPTGAGVPLSDVSTISQAFDRCEPRAPLAAEIGLSGSAGGQRLRGTLHAGFAPPDALRLEAVAPFGGPVFVLAGRDDEATLLLTREDRVVTGAPGAILEALVGVQIAPAALHAWVRGCPSATGPLTAPRRLGDEWVAADVGDRTVWLRRIAGQPVLAAETRGTLTVEFLDPRDRQPRRLRLRQAAASGLVAIDVGLALDQVEAGVALDGSAFAVDIPPGAVPLTVEELRSAGPLRDVRPES